MDLSQKYVEIPEFKKNSCINIDQLIPELKMTKDEKEEGPSDARAEAIKLNKRKRRRYKNSFLNSKNIVSWADTDLND